MSSYVSIGFVFEKDQNIKSLLSKFLDFLITKGEFKKIAYSEDENGDKWNEKVINDYSAYMVASLMVDNYFGRTNITAAIFNDEQINLDVSIYKFPQGDFGFLIEITLEQLSKHEKKEELEKSTYRIINFCKTLFSMIEYRYAYCDQEVPIEYTWDEFNQLDKCVYSISIIPHNNAIDIKLAAWDIDGLTNRLR